MIKEQEKMHKETNVKHQNVAAQKKAAIFAIEVDDDDDVQKIESGVTGAEDDDDLHDK